MTSQAELEALVAKRMTGVSVTGRATGREQGRSLASYYRADNNNIMGRKYLATPRDQLSSPQSDETTEGDT